VFAHQRSSACLHHNSQIEADCSGALETVTIELDGKRCAKQPEQELFSPSRATPNGICCLLLRMADFICFLRDRALVCGATPTESRDKLFFRRTCAKVAGVVQDVPVDSEHRGEIIQYATASDALPFSF